MAKNSRRRKSEAAEGLPEGPYEADSSQIQLASNAAMLETIEFIAALRGKGIDSLSIDPRNLGIVIHLMRNHVGGRLTTMSSLATASGLSYGTAFRAIEGLVEDGLIVRRPRTTTGRSFSMHPSSELLRRWQLFNGYTHRLIEQMTGRGAPPIRKPAGNMSAVIAPPTVLEASSHCRAVCGCWFTPTLPSWP